MQSPETDIVEKSEEISPETEEQLEIREHLEEGWKLVGSADDGLINWYLEKDGIAKWAKANIKAQYDKVIKKIDAMSAARAYKFENQIFNEVVRRVAELKKGKTIDFLHGSIQLRTRDGKVEVRDPKAFSDWLEKQPDDVREQLEPCFERVFRRVTPLKEYMDSTGEVDIPGVHETHLSQYILLKHRAIERS